MSVTSYSDRKLQKCRIVFLGDQDVGKTSLIERYTFDRFDETQSSTVCIDFNVKDVTHLGTCYRLQMWDTAGQERYRSLIPTYLKNAHCVIFVFDVSRAKTLDNVKVWHQMFLENQEAPGFMVATKTDLPNRKVSKSEGEQMAKELGLKYLEVSAKTGKRVQQLFREILETIIVEKHNEKQDRSTTIDHLEGKQNKDKKNVELEEKTTSVLRRLPCC